MEEYLSTYFGSPSSKLEIQRIVDTVARKCTKPPGMTDEEIKANLALQILETH